MMKKVSGILAAFVLICGCSGHEPDPNTVMMDKVMGELDRETAK